MLVYWRVLSYSFHAIVPLMAGKLWFFFKGLRVRTHNLLIPWDAITPHPLTAISTTTSIVNYLTKVLVEDPFRNHHWPGATCNPRYPKNAKYENWFPSWMAGWGSAVCSFRGRAQGHNIEAVTKWPWLFPVKSYPVTVGLFEKSSCHDNQDFIWPHCKDLTRPGPPKGSWGRDIPLKYD